MAGVGVGPPPPDASPQGGGDSRGQGGRRPSGHLGSFLYQILVRTQRPSEAVINITPSSQVETEARTGAELASGGSDPDGLALTLTFNPLLAVKFLV